MCWQVGLVHHTCLTMFDLKVDCFNAIRAERESKNIFTHRVTQKHGAVPIFVYKFMNTYSIFTESQ